MTCAMILLSRGERGAVSARATARRFSRAERCATERSPSGSALLTNRSILLAVCFVVRKEPAARSFASRSRVRMRVRVLSRARVRVSRPRCAIAPILSMAREERAMSDPTEARGMRACIENERDMVGFGEACLAEGCDPRGDVIKDGNALP